MNEYLSILEYYGYKTPEVSYDAWEEDLERFVSAGPIEKDQEQHALMPVSHFCMNDLPAKHAGARAGRPQRRRRRRAQGRRRQVHGRRREHGLQGVEGGRRPVPPVISPRPSISAPRPRGAARCRRSRPTSPARRPLVAAVVLEL